ncbi:MAG: hypothetical protein JJU37_12465 [Balneolaceae bacterium]|nr:hypothetical protein [Balneolaceae bacterium]
MDNFTLKTINRNVSTHCITLTFIFCFIISVVASSEAVAQQQERQSLSLSLGASVGYAPILTYGINEDTGMLINLFGDLRHRQIIGQLKFSYALSETIGDLNFDEGYGFFGSLGYIASISEHAEIPFMLTGGASYITYSSTSSNSFFDVSTQFGITISPFYQLNEQFSIYSAFRYLKGIDSENRDDAIDLMDISLGLRLTL